MDLDALLKSQQDWLDRAIGALGDPRSGDPDASSPEAVRTAGLQTARARLARLETQREQTLRRLDLAIEEEKAAITRIEKLGRETPDTPRPQGKATRRRASGPTERSRKSLK
jgi:hypothetical protein